MCGSRGIENQQPNTVVPPLKWLIEQDTLIAIEGMRNNKTMRKQAMADFLSGWFFALENKDDIKMHECSLDAK